MTLKSAFIFAFVLVSNVCFANSELKADWQHHQLTITDLAKNQAKFGGKINFPNLFIFNHKNEITGMTLKGATGLFKNIELDNLPSRPLPETPKIKGTKSLLSAILPKNSKQGHYTVALMIANENLVYCEPCITELEVLDNLFAQKTNKNVQLKLITVSN